MKRPVIMLTGVTGQLGSELWQGLQNLGEVVPCVHPAERDAFGFAADLLDLADPAAVRSAVARIKPNVIVNPAAYTAVDKAETETALATAINVTAVHALAEGARALGAAVIHFSTDYVFRGDGERPWRETDPTGPLGAYGRTKLAGEDALRAVDVPHIVLRTSWVYGAHGHNFVKTMLRLGQTREELRVVADQIGAPTSARTLCDLTVQILAQARGDFAGFCARNAGVYHAVNAGTTSWHGFATRIFQEARALNLPLKVAHVTPITTAEYPVPAQRPANSRLDTTKLFTTFGLQPAAWDVALKSLLPAIISRL